MTRWFRRGDPPRATARHSRLTLWILDSREAPSNLTGLPDPIIGQMPSTLPGVPGQPAPGPAQNQAPSISDFKAVVGDNGKVTFSGRVTDDQPVAGYVVRITGPGVDVTAVVKADGTFQVTTTVNAPGSVSVAARVTDGFGATSDPVYTTFTPSP